MPQRDEPQGNMGKLNPWSNCCNSSTFPEFFRTLHQIQLQIRWQIWSDHVTLCFLLFFSPLFLSSSHQPISFPKTHNFEKIQYPTSLCMCHCWDWRCCTSSAQQSKILIDPFGAMSWWLVNVVSFADLIVFFFFVGWLVCWVRCSYPLLWLLGLGSWLNHSRLFFTGEVWTSRLLFDRVGCRPPILRYACSTFSWL